MSSSNECGTITNKTSIRWARAVMFICPKVIETCRSAMRQRAAGRVPADFIPREVPCALTPSRVACHSVLHCCRSRSGRSWRTFGRRRRAIAPRRRWKAPSTRSITPGDDFFAYANGAWLKAAVIPAGKDRWSVRDDINEVTRRQIAAILDDARAATPGSLARRVADFRSAFLNDSAIEAKGIAPLAPMLAQIDDVGDTLALTRLLGRSMHADVDPLNYRHLHLIVGARTFRGAQHPR